jgi:hypothetical protein
MKHNRIRKTRRTKKIRRRTRRKVRIRRARTSNSQMSLEMRKEATKTTKMKNSWPSSNVSMKIL